MMKLVAGPKLSGGQNHRGWGLATWVLLLGDGRRQRRGADEMHTPHKVSGQVGQATQGSGSGSPG